MKRKMCFRIAFAILVIGIMIAVFLFSSQSGEDSNHLSKGILERIFEFFNVDADPLKLDQYNLVLRKIAHFSLYFLLGTGTMGFLLTTSLKVKYSFVLSLLFCILFAATDELHQFLSGTRNGNPLDVLLDSAGALLSILLLSFAVKVKDRMITRR
ncbi:VanZ family protein [Negativibacillus massiliensis]|uniref:VanZ family protein n=1 Tax=Negativibacillus massiliensis TaxID=1871035 RepID=UPI003AF21CB9